MSSVSSLSRHLLVCSWSSAPDKMVTRRILGITIHPAHLLVVLLLSTLHAEATLPQYDRIINEDEASNGLAPTAKLTEAVSFDGSNHSPFEFGQTADAVTIEFVLEGDPVAGGPDGYLAVGANSSSNLRYEQWRNTGQLGFTQLGVADYLFSPLVVSPTEPTHITYVWDGDGRMQLYLDGVLAGENTQAGDGFTMPTGSGLLGNNSRNSEGMVGTIHRVTVYDEALDATTIRRHADAYNGITYPPVINAFTATPEAYLSPGDSTLTWDVSNADALSINGIEVSGLEELVVSPTTSTLYTLTASNGDGTALQDLTVTVNPAPTIQVFSADRTIINDGESVTLSWQTRYATGWSIAPAPGDVSGLSPDGAGSVTVAPARSTTYTLTAGNAFGSADANVEVVVAVVATHPVISEFMADNESVLTDGDGDHSDWIEVFNPTGASIDLAGHHLTDDETDLTKWTFPPLVLEPGGRVVVFASNKHPSGPAGELHTNFRLNRNGEYLALVAPDGVTVLHEFSPGFPPQPNDVSYGILGGDPSREQFMGVPTPGMVNDSTLPPPPVVTFSLPSQTFTGSVEVELASESAGATIFYTTDGSEPSSTNGIRYAAPVFINATTHLRAVAEFAGQRSPVSGQTYVRLAPDLVGYQSDLPLLVIDNFGAGSIPAKGWSVTGAGVQQVARQPAMWATFDRDPDTGMAALADAPQMISRAGIRGRGAFSSTWKQKPYNVEAWDEHAAERDVEVLGMPAHADWVLYYPDTDDNKDPPMMFNTFMYELALNMGHEATRYRWVEAFINEDGGDLSLADRRGVYAIMEKVSRGKDRLDFERLSEDGTTGGWLLELNRMDAIPPEGFPAPNGATQPQFFHTKGPDRISQTAPNTAGGGDDIPRQSNGYLNFDNPGGYKINPAQRAAIEGWFEQFEDVLYDDALWLDPIDGYRRYIDPVDFVEYFIFNNLSRNGDGMLISIFPWLGNDGRLRMGPPWDYNWSSYYIGGGPTGTVWHRSDRLWYGRLFRDPDFKQLYIDRWFLHRDGPMSNAAMEAIIDRQAAEIGVERALSQGVSNAAAWEEELTRFKNWLTTRADWYDGQFAPRPMFHTPGGEVPDGFIVTFLPPPGAIYFTTDGSDPRAAGGGVAATARQYDGGILLTSLVRSGDPVRAVVPTSDHPPSGLGWTAPSGFDDSAWILGSTGVGYDRNTTYDPEIRLNLAESMDRKNTSAYLRLEFSVVDPAVFDSLTLKMKYDDGFIAYLNGVEIAEDFAPANPGWNSTATGQRPDAEAMRFVSFPVDEHVSDLRSGLNVLAIHGINASLNSSDFLIVPELVAGQSSVASGLALHESTWITARTRIGTDWSAPANAYFFVNTIAANATNLVISEIHYRPADASPAELAAGLSNRDDFEFVEVMNTRTQTLNLSGVRFVRTGSAGIDFDFSDTRLRTLAPGGRLLLVRNRAAFELRHGTGLADQIAGEYSGNLSNDGDTLTLLDASGEPIHAFTYNDKSPWPEGPDGGGFSLVLINPGQSPPPDHGDPFNWRASLAVGGTPGGSAGLAYADWKAAHGLSTPETDPDPDRDGRPNIFEFVEGTLPHTPDSAPGLRATIEPIDVGGLVDNHCVFRFQRSLVADDVALSLEISNDLVAWESGPTAVVFLGRERTEVGKETLLFRSTSPISANSRLFARMRADQP